MLLITSCEEASGEKYPELSPDLYRGRKPSNAIGIRSAGLEGAGTAEWEPSPVMCYVAKQNPMIVLGKYCLSEEDAPPQGRSLYGPPGQIFPHRGSFP